MLNTNKEMTEWEKTKGIEFLKRIGIKPKQKVLDFGARTGHYSVPLSKIVGSKGKVFALDKINEPLKELKAKKAKQELTNISIIKSNGNTKIELKNDSVDVALVYDVLHLIENRKKLYKEIHRVLQENGLFSLYPKHNKLDQPLKNLKNMCEKDIIREIENNGFCFEKKYCGLISHNDYLNKGCILNFKKKQGRQKNEKKN